MQEAILKLENICKSYKDGENKELTILQNINLELFKADSVGLLSPSGSGKSTLLQIAGLVSLPSLGNVYINGKKCNFKSDHSITKLRRQSIGFIYQFHHLLNEFTSVENIMLPMLINNKSKQEAKESAIRLLKQVNLEEKAEKFPHELSGGQKQRVAIARAFANKPSLLIADEPTGNLDNKLARSAFDLILNFIEENKTSAIIATHNVELASVLGKRYLINPKGELESVL